MTPILIFVILQFPCRKSAIFTQDDRKNSEILVQVNLEDAGKLQDQVLVALIVEVTLGFEKLAKMVFSDMFRFWMFLLMIQRRGSLVQNIGNIVIGLSASRTICCIRCKG
ncbi:hypothetical protein SS50377_26050 [Spironucleus salmonicida]|uniref:Uncharacterized protein n=1 Tax=Spironucleus salmonicida TaxID=348837 RepID=A0A9P8LPK1_9EUKA|nr:hypothetical protein SS50377_26050 [Spironucleus salmonicida]